MKYRKGSTITSFVGGFLVWGLLLATSVQADEDLLESPINQAYAGGEFVLFLHEDTSITGMGSNTQNVLNREGGLNANTADFVEVHGPTGFEYLKTKQGRAYGYRPLDGSEGLFDVYRLERGLSSVETGVRDYDNSGRSGYLTGNTRDSFARVSEEGYVYLSGNNQDGERFGRGPYWQERRNGSNERLLAPEEIDGELIMDGFSRSSSEEGSHVSEAFEPMNEQVSIQLKYQDKQEEYEDMVFEVEVEDSEGEVVYSIADPYRVTSNHHTDARYLPIKDLDENEEYKVHVTNENTGFEVKIFDRVHFENAKEVHKNTNTEASFVVIDEEERMYIHKRRYSWIEEVEVPDDVELDISTFTTGKDDDYYVLDENGEVWYFNSSTLRKVDFPEYDGVDFFENYEISEIDSGNEFIMVIAENRDTEDTYVMAWGSNESGELGLENVGTDEEVDEPTFITRDGERLSNITTIAAGNRFSVFVQNTDEGQLVYTSGSNNRGQLGGGLEVSVSEPQPIPGVRGVEDVFIQNSPEVVTKTEEGYLAFGGVRSYPEEVTFSSLIESELIEWHQASTGFHRESVFSRPTSPSVLLTEEGVPHGFGGTYRNGRGSDTQWGPITIADKFVGDNSVGREDDANYFRNVRDAAPSHHAGSVVDENGRLWGWGNASRSGVREFATHFGNEGQVQSTQYAHPMTMSDGELAPPKFKNITASRYALTDEGKIWRVTSDVNPLSSSWEINDYEIVYMEGSLNTRTIAIDSEGSVWTWGWGNTPSKIDFDFDDRKIVHASISENHYLMVDEEGDVWSFGQNDYGKLGTGSMEDEDIPVKVENVGGAVKVYAHTDGSYALDENGRLWAWGYNAFGSLGNNFSLERNAISTAVGNDLPVMSIENEIRTTYLSEEGNSDVRLHGTIQEPDMETTTIQASVLGLDKEFEVESETWDLDVYDEVIPQEWELSWNLSEIDESNDSQYLTSIVAEDERGGIVQQFFSGDIIVDNEAPEAPQWGEVCFVENRGEEDESEVCHDKDYFERGGSNGVDQPIRLYIEVAQKSGSDRAPVFPEVQYRERHHYGYTNDWSEWEPVVEENEEGYYIDVYQGFLGEHQFRVRAADEAGNSSERQESSVYTILSNAGAEVQNMDLSAHSDGIQDLYNEIMVEVDSPDGSGIRSYKVERWLDGDTNDEGDEKWSTLTGDRISHEEEELALVDDAPELLGNAKYYYRANAENSVATGEYFMDSLYTNPLIPTNFTTNPDEEGITFVASQDDNNRGEVLYRLVLVDNMTGETHAEDIVSSNTNSDIIFDIDDADVPFAIVNNSIQVQLLLRGENGNFVTEIYNEDYMNSPEVSNDVVPPDAMLNIIGNTEIDREAQNTISVGVFANDNVSPPENLDVQFSFDGESWRGVDGSGRWIENHWASYQNEYSGLELPERLGRHMLYVRVRDDAGNVGHDHAELSLTSPLNRSEGIYVEDIGVLENEDFSSTESIHTNSSQVTIDVPRSGDAQEIGYSFDGVNWSVWEQIRDAHEKRVALPTGQGHRNIYTRYRNEHGSQSDIEDGDVLDYIVDTEPPEALIETQNGTFITEFGLVPLQVTATDNYSEEVMVNLQSTEQTLLLEGDDELLEVEKNQILMEEGQRETLIVDGLETGFNQITFRLEDKAGNHTSESIRMFRQ